MVHERDHAVGCLAAFGSGRSVDGSMFPYGLQRGETGGSAADVLTGGNGTDLGSFTYNLLSAGDGQNMVAGGGANGGASVQNYISSGGGDDVLTGGSASGAGSFVYNLLQAGEGHDILTGGGASGGGSVQTFAFAGGGAFFT